MSNNAWPLRRLSSLCTVISSGGTPSRSRPEFFADDGHLWVKSKELLDRGVATTEERISDAALKASSAKLYPENTVLIAMYGANVGQLGWLQRSASVNQAICALVADREVAEPRYLFYALIDARPALIAQAFGAAQQNLNQGLIRDFEVRCPPLPTQQRVTAILSAYDDLIENNTRRIAILEEMARLLYREWFVDFRFPGHENVAMAKGSTGLALDGWHEVPLFDVSEVTYGYPFKSKLFTDEPVGMPVARIRDVLAGRSATFTQEPAPEKYMLVNGDLLVGMDGEFHIGTWIGGAALLNQRVARLRSTGTLCPLHLRLAVEGPIKHFETTILGTTVAHLGDKHLREVRLLIPPAHVRVAAAAALEPQAALMLNLRLKNEALRTTRDLLLPKLISGEVDAKDLDIEVGELSE